MRNEHRSRAVWLASIALIGAVSVALPSPARAVTCAPDGTPPTNADAGTVVLADDFETGDLRNWTVVDREGDATVGVESYLSKDGACGLRLASTTRWDSRANVRKDLPSTNQTIRASGWFRVEREGVLGSNVPIWRFFDGSKRIIDVYRQNLTGAVWLRTSNGSGGWWYVPLARNLTLHTWVYVKLNVTASWSSSTVTVWADGTKLYDRVGHWLPTNHLTRAMLGSEHVRQQMDLIVDDAIIKVG